MAFANASVFRREAMLKDVDGGRGVVKDELVVMSEKSSHPAREDYANG
jgi:hypothetical protein